VNVAFPSAAFISSATACPSFSFMSDKINDAPFLANSYAKIFPKPEAEPVINTTFSENSMCFVGVDELK
jgi:hypothetical protein